jgi:sugar lactone lactonase YvrE
MGENMNINAFRRRRQIVAIALVMLACGTPSHACCANLWISSGGGGIESYTEGQLARSGTATPIHLGTFDTATGIAFDDSHNLWAVVDGDKVVRFTPAQLKNLGHDPNPTPKMTIKSPFAFRHLYGCGFDNQGNLWVVDTENSSIDELSQEQLEGDSGNVAPHVIITSAELVSPNYVTFDKAGNAWVDSKDGDQIAEFAAGELTSSGTKSAEVLLSDDGDCTNLCAPGEIAFDRKGDLWVPNEGADTVVEFAKDQLTSSGKPAPMVTLSSAIFNAPRGAVFDINGNLVVTNYSDGTISKFAAGQLKVSGAPTPEITVMGSKPEETGCKN